MKKLVTDIKVRSFGWGGSVAILKTADGMNYQLGKSVQQDQIHEYDGGLEMGGKTFLYVK